MNVRVRRGAPLGQQVADLLRTRIIKGELTPGTRLVEEALGAEYDVSRGPVRDALHRLAVERLVEETQGAGAFVRGLDADDIEQLYSLREALEQLAVAKVIARRQEIDWGPMGTCVAEMFAAAETSDPVAFSQADLELHSLVYELAAHPRLMAVWEQIRPTFAVLLDLTIDYVHNYDESAEDHRRLFDVIRTGSEAEAKALVSRHLADSQLRMRHRIPGQRES
jgi:DNA-binding GntR family transcriptional regulator